MFVRTVTLTADRNYDLIVIGGGITGSGVARDAALRGLSTLLLEKGDFSSGVSSKSTRLIHGGLRYLANFELDLVAESLRERAVLRKLAPYLMQPIPILIPIYRQDRHGRMVVSIGIRMYDLLSREKDVPHYVTCGKAKTLEFEPRLKQEGLTGSALFYDNQIILPERLVIENILSARQNGAVLHNYVRAEKIMESGDGIVVTARDALSGKTYTVRSRVLVNAAGPWIDTIRRAGGIEEKNVIHPTKGIHIILPRLTEQALFVASRDERMFFIIPFGSSSLVGTTDTRYDADLDDVHANMEDVNYLLNESRRILPGTTMTKQAIHYTYAGIRPLAFKGRSESRISRKHRVLREGRTGRIITIAGGKYTTYRNMAEDAVDAVCKVLKLQPKCITGTEPFPGGLPAAYEEFMNEAIPDLSLRYHVSPATVSHLIQIYGSRTEKVLELTRGESALAETITPESKDVYAQVVFGVMEEEARTVSDIILRRMHLGITASRGLPHAATIAEIAGKVLGWSKEEISHRAEEFKKEIRKDSEFLKG